jgi:hypothetical protein
MFVLIHSCTVCDRGRGGGVPLLIHVSEGITWKVKIECKYDANNISISCVIEQSGLEVRFGLVVWRCSARFFWGIGYRD